MSLTVARRANSKETIPTRLHKTYVRHTILLKHLMSEPFSIATGPLGVLRTADGIAKDTHDFVSGIKSAPKRIRSLSADINTFYSLLCQPRTGFA